MRATASSDRVQEIVLEKPHITSAMAAALDQRISVCWKATPVSKLIRERDTMYLLAVARLSADRFNVKSLASLVSCSAQ